MSEKTVLPPFEVVKYAFLLWCFLLLTPFISFHVTSRFILSAFIAFFGIVFWGLKLFAIPPPNPKQCAAILDCTTFPNGGAVFAHRGAALDAPENTIAAIKYAAEKGAWGVEFDLSFTQDNVAILLHDDSVDRTTDSRGAICDLSFGQLTNVDAAAKHPLHDKFPDTRIPTFEAAIEECLRLKLKMLIDVKEYDERAIKAINSIFQTHPELYRSAIVASFYSHFVYSLRKTNPDIVTALIWRPKFISYFDADGKEPRTTSAIKLFLLNVADYVHSVTLHWLQWYIIGVSAVFIYKGSISQDYVQQWTRRNIKVLTWTPNGKEEKEYFTKHLRISVITDTLI